MEPHLYIKKMCLTFLIFLLYIFFFYVYIFYFTIWESIFSKINCILRSYMSLYLITTLLYVASNPIIFIFFISVVLCAWIQLVV